MSADFRKLLSEVRDCQICLPHLPDGVRPVLQADPAAPILIAGQAPGIRVHRSGIPFDDPSGDRLRQWMGIDKSVFYDPKKVAILPMGFCYPGTGKSGDLPPRPECAPAWREALLQQLPNIRLILILGQYAQKYHLGKARKKNLTATVLAWREYWPQALPLPHPSPRNNIWLSKNRWFEGEVLPELQKYIGDLLK